MRRALWLLPVFLLLGLWLWSNPHAPSDVPATHRASSETSSSPAPSSEPAATGTGSVPAPVARSAEPARYPAFLPPEAHGVLQRIARGGPFEYRQDGHVFQNRERRLPAQPRGYYREYTVATPGSPDRGARRIITGGDPPGEYWYTDDHYRSFRRFKILEIEVQQ